MAYKIEHHKVSYISYTCIFYLFRRAPEGRQKAKEDIEERTLATDQDLPQLFLCPEGTTTNRRVLIQFKVIIQMLEYVSGLFYLFQIMKLYLI